MGNKLNLLFAAATLVTAASNVNAQTLNLGSDVKQAIEVVKADEIKADIAYLADDKLKGRGPGTGGYQMAVDYVIGRLKSMHVQPAGENGSWLQDVHIRRALTQSPVLTFNNAPLAGAFNIYPNPVTPAVKGSSQIVFAGYGISQPALGYDDYAGLDVKGKTVIIIRGTPDKFSSSVAAHVANGLTLLKAAAAHGAVGVIVASTDSVVRNPNAVATPLGSNSIMRTDGKVAVSHTYYSEQIKLYGTMSYAAAKAVFANSEKSFINVVTKFKAGEPQSFDLKGKIDFSYASTYKDILSYNIVGKITGSDAKLKNEYVVHSAHLDHLGIGRPVEGDSIYNGAHDNASGVASLLGIAKVYDNLKIKPKRSILVVMVTGEEMGDLGSGYFASHPTVPVKNIVADVNTDMPTIIAPLLSIAALGAEHSTLNKQVDEAAGYLGLSVEPDPEPKQARFTRSDQYSFVLEGIPALHIKYGSKTPDGKNNLNDFVAIWRAKYYHKPQDDINGIFDFEAGRKYAQLNFLIGYLVAQDPAKPSFNAGDIFASKQ
ncbi:M28 family peptidase [Mucilaginibacter ginkgonis]|uniref:M28 family peptidase n=1 Tax=Mucilaginibacter ginkgonis TaxID=2682091 RepID=A0A6I4HVJ7_9SPHI|nr:M28 family peptidase [Mucilaginibacter ginkgonis]QQL50919.1 M28 family peptidase [Mucilaginibacter ginkgonis]